MMRENEHGEKEGGWRAPLDHVAVALLGHEFVNVLFHCRKVLERIRANAALNGRFGEALRDDALGCGEPAASPSMSHSPIALIVPHFLNMALPFSSRCGRPRASNAVDWQREHKSLHCLASSPPLAFLLIPLARSLGRHASLLG